jgi:hypothetical protein
MAPLNALRVAIVPDVASTLDAQFIRIFNLPDRPS